jgi:hypothetical protein
VVAQLQFDCAARRDAVHLRHVQILETARRDEE